MKLRTLAFVMMAVMVIPVMAAMCMDNTEATSTNVTPGGATTAATLTYSSYWLDTYNSLYYIGWQLDISVPDSQQYSATISIDDMNTVLSAENVGSMISYAQTNSVQNNTDITNAGITITYQNMIGNLWLQDKITVSGTSPSSGGDYTYNNAYSQLPYQAIRDSRWVVVGSGNVAGNSNVNTCHFITIVLHVTQNYTLTYDTQGGSFSSTPTTVFPANTVVTLNTNISKTGHTFGGWSYGGNIVQQVTMDGNKTVTANWSENSYTVTFDANGGTFGDPSDASKSVTYGQQYGVMPTPAKSGYTLAGWFTNTTDYVRVLPTDTYTLISNQTLYAMWVETNSVYMKAGGGVNPLNADAVLSYTYGNWPTWANIDWTLDITVPRTQAWEVRITTDIMNDMILQASGQSPSSYSIGTHAENNAAMNTAGISVHYQTSIYTPNTVFLSGTAPSTVGDYTYTNTISPNYATTTWYFGDGPINFVTINIHVTDNWYTLTYDTQGGSFSSTPTTLFAANTVVNLATDISKTGHTFGGWSYGGNIVQQVTMDGNKTVTANWSENSYTVTFDANGGTFGDPSDASKSVTYGQQYGVMPTPAKSGYTLAGWFTNTTDYVRVLPTDTYTLISNQTLYAMWVETNSVYMKAGGGVNPLNADAVLSYTYGNWPTWANIDWTLDITVPRTQAWEVRITTDIMNDMILQASGQSPSSYSIGTHAENNAAMNTAGISVHYQTSIYTPNTVFLSGTAPSTVGDYTYTNTISPNYATTTWYFGDGPINFVTINIHVQPSYTVTFDVNGGDPLDEDTMDAFYLQEYGPMPTPTRAGYIFDGWYTQSSDGDLVVSGDIYSLTADQTLYAHWTQSITYWTNGNPNGSVSILYHLDDTGVTNDLITNARLLRYDPSVTDDPNTQYNESFIDTGYYLQIEIISTKVGNSYDAQAIARLYNGNDGLIAQGYNDFGAWGSFIITMDTMNATVSYTKVMQFRSFTDYQESVSGTILSYGDNQTYTSLSTYELKMTPISAKVPRQSITNTSVFLNTFGVVLTDPSIDISQYFPEMTEARLNFYSFALYGQSMTVNGHTMDVTAPNITVYYKQNNNNIVIQDGPGDDVKSRMLELTNIYITWTETHCYLTFADSDFTIDMGTYTDKNVSFGGIWYFSTALYDPYTATETQYSIDWWHTNFDMSSFGVVMAGILILLALLSKATIGGRTIDYVIVGFGVIVALIIAGGVINA